MNSSVSLEQFEYKRSMPAVLLSVAAICIIIALTIRNCGLHPTVFADEWWYSKFSRLAPISGSPYPSYLYLLLFGISRRAVRRAEERELSGRVLHPGRRLKPWQRDCLSGAT